VHIAIIGVGRVGAALAFRLIFEPYIDELTLVDIIPGLAGVVKEDIYHGLATYGLDMRINSYDDCRHVENADMIVITAGVARKPSESRRDLAEKNSKIIYDIIECLADRNPKAWYVIITNPVDALATLVSKLLGDSKRVIGTGTSLDTTRFRCAISRSIGVPLSYVEAYTGGEHGEHVVLLWSTVHICGMPLDEYLSSSGKQIDKKDITNYVKNISSKIISMQGGTMWGPAIVFSEIIKNIILNTGRIMSVSTLRKFKEISEPVHVTIPTKVGWSIGPDIWNILDRREQEEIVRAAEAIYKTYMICLKSLKSP